MKLILLIILLILFGVNSYGQNARVVGYLPKYRFHLSDKIEYCKLTHLNLSFANPNEDGKIIMSDISSVISDAKNDNPSIVICISIAGGGLTAQQKTYWSNLIDIPANRPALISNILNYVLENKIDGVDVDLEWDAVTSGYSDFVIELGAALKVHNKILTAAFPNQRRFDNISDAALEVFDFINIMSYDGTGPWKPSAPGQHSSYNYALNGIDLWKNTVGITGSKLTLGIPFYGYNFINSTTATAFTYGSMVAEDVQNADLDKVGNSYYNGRPTIESKVELANAQVGGIMIWEIGQDSFDEYSLLKAIHNKYTSLGTKTTGLCGNDIKTDVSTSKSPSNLIVYPNPTSNFLNIRIKETEIQKPIILNSQGQIMDFNIICKSSELRIDVSKLQPGFYYIIIVKKDSMVLSEKFVKTEN